MKRCFVCNEEKRNSEIKKSGERFGGTWHLCFECSDRYHEEKKLQTEKRRYRAGICCPRCGTIDGRHDDGKRLVDGRRVWCEDCDFEFILREEDLNEEMDEETSERLLLWK